MTSADLPWKGAEGCAVTRCRDWNAADDLHEEPGLHALAGAQTRRRRRQQAPTQPGANIVAGAFPHAWRWERPSCLLGRCNPSRRAMRSPGSGEFFPSASADSASPIRAMCPLASKLRRRGRTHYDRDRPPGRWTSTLNVPGNVLAHSAALRWMAAWSPRR